MEDLSEKEQLDAMRAWWSEHGSYIISGIVVGVIIIVGLNQWRATKANDEIAASSLYEEVMSAVGNSSFDTAVEKAAELFGDYNDSPYAAQARLAMARLYMDNARDQDAADILTALIDSNPDKEISLVGRHRLAKILLYQGKAEEVIGLISDQPDSAFSSRFNEVLGDAYVELGQFEKAEIAYFAALNDDPQAPTVEPTLIQLKINDLPQPVDTGIEAEDIGIEAEPGDPVESDSATEEADNVPSEDGPANEAATEPAADAESGNK